jgi:sec-independent protein translocase protein TatB
VGLSFGEILVLAILGLVVIGPKDLPKLLRMAGRLIGQAKRAVADVRRDTGLDEVLRGDFQDLERLADHIESVDPYRGEPKLTTDNEAAALRALHEHEYPAIGADAQGLLPDDAPVYLDAKNDASAPVATSEKAEEPAEPPAPAAPEERAAS